MRHVPSLPIAPICSALLLSACGQTAVSAPTTGTTLHVVAAENFWGNIASQLGGAHVSVTSVVTDPNADPHEYESSTSDARVFADANYVIINGAGYDSWSQRLLDANPSSSRKVLDVSALLGKGDHDNPHFWYNPQYVTTVADRITADLRAVDAANRDYYTQQRVQFTSNLQPYTQLIASIKSKYSGTKIAATENIVAYMANALNLSVISPQEFMQAIAEGNDPPAGTVAEFQQQLTNKEPAILIYNNQTVTNVTTNIKTLANSQGIPVVGVSETMQPVTTTFQNWQVTQLQAISDALSHATGH